MSVAEVVALADALAALEAEQAINPMMAAAIRLLTLTACRKSEITGLKWTWVDLGRSCLRLPDSKTGAKVVPLAAMAVELLASLPRTSPFVLPSNKTDGAIVGLQKAWGAVRIRATSLARSQAVEAGEPADQAPDFTDRRRRSASGAGSSHLPISPADPLCTNRARLVAGIEPWASARPQYALKLGPLLISFDALTDEAVAALRSRIAGDVRRERARRRSAGRPTFPSLPEFLTCSCVIAFPCPPA